MWCGYQLHQILVLIFYDKMEYDRSKNENWKIKKKMKWDEIKHTWRRVIPVCVFRYKCIKYLIPMSNVDMLNNVEIYIIYTHIDERRTHTHTQQLVYIFSTMPNPNSSSYNIRWLLLLFAGSKPKQQIHKEKLLKASTKNSIFLLPFDLAPTI